MLPLYGFLPFARTSTVSGPGSTGKGTPSDDTGNSVPFSAMVRPGGALGSALVSDRRVSRSSRFWAR